MSDGPLSTFEGGLMVQIAHRHCLTSGSYVCAPCITWLKRVWGDLSPETRATILQETNAFLESRPQIPWAVAHAWREFFDTMNTQPKS